MNAVNVFNVESSLNNWLSAQIATYTPPSFFSGYPGTQLILNMPESPLNVPAFSAHHLMVETFDLYQGRRVGLTTYGVRYEAFMDVSVWVSRQYPNWAADKRWMASILQDIATGTKSVSITDYLTNYPTSAGTDNLVYIDRIDARQTVPDANPDFERERFLILYHCLLRSDIS
jgi:hypothetical protein